MLHQASTKVVSVARVHFRLGGKYTFAVVEIVDLCKMLNNFGFSYPIKI